ncbi:MAG: ferrochelatase [Rhodothermales bacterium]
MTPREFLKRYSYDDRLVTGEFFPSEPLKIERGDTVGIVLMNLGGPSRREDVEPFLYNLFMDPAIIDIPVGGILRHWLCRFIASRRSETVGQDYEVIGGGSPINRLTREQARSLEVRLVREYGDQVGVEFKTYLAMRYWHPLSEEAARKMEADGVDKVLLLPLFPQYSKTTTGSGLVYWHALQEAGEIPKWETTYVSEYAANPKYIQAVSERIDEALQRFPKGVRGEAELLFSAHGTPLKEMKERHDPYCCLIHSTVDRVMAQRDNDHPFHVSFQSKVGPMEWLTPSTVDKVHALAAEGVKALVVVPIAFVTDHIETAYELDVELREVAEEGGIDHFEVSSGLNCHPLFIEALAEAAVSQLILPEGVGTMSASGDGVASGEAYPLRPLDDLPRFRGSERCVRCHQCERVTEARRWDLPSGTPETSPNRTQASR